MPLRFELLSEIKQVTTIAVGRSIRDVKRLRKWYGAGRWLKQKGIATVRFEDGTITRAEVHWYEAHGIGRKEVKVKQLLP